MSKTRKLSDHIPFDIQSEIIKRLPVKSLLQFRPVSKKWKSFIDSPEFIKSYHINHTNLQHHLLVEYELDTVQTYTFIIDNNTFPQQKFPLTTPKSLGLLRDTFTLGYGNGLLCLYTRVDSETEMAVIWNPTVRKSVGIVIPMYEEALYIVGFGVCPDRSDPMLVKIHLNKICNTWVVEVFTLSTRVWKTVYTGAPFKSCDFSWSQAFVDGVIYFLAYDDEFNLVISFDLKSEKFGEVCLPDILVHTPDLNVTKVNESLGLLEYHYEGGMVVCCVWSRKDGTNNQFTKIYAIKVEGKWLCNWALGFRKNGEVVIELDTDNSNESRIAIYEPFSGHINDVGSNGELREVVYGNATFA